MEDVKSWFNAKRQRNILIVIILILLAGVGLAFNKISNLNTDLAIAEQNEKALNDSVRVMENRLGDVEYAKNILISEKKDLKNLNKNLAEELKKEKGKVFELTEYIANISNTNPDGSVDTVYVDNYLVVYADGDYGLEWEHDTIYDANNERHLAGISKFNVDSSGLVTPLETIITRDEIKFNVVQGLREKDGNVEMFVRSDYPNFEVEELDAVIIDPMKHPVLKKFTKPKRWGIGPYIGVGLQYGFNNKLSAGVQGGLSIHYSILRF